MKKFLSLLIAVIIVIPFNLFSLGASAQTSDSKPIIEFGEASEYGYLDYHFLDEDGHKIVSQNKYGVSQDSLYTNSASSIPSSYDARDYGYVTPVRNQGLAGNCWAFAAIAAMETDSIVQGIDDVETADYSEAHLVWFSHNEQPDDVNDPTYGDHLNAEGVINPDSPYTSAGNHVIASGALARWSGLAEESDYPFYPNDLSKMGNYTDSDRYNTNAGVVIKSVVDLDDHNDVKQWILEHGSAVMAYYHNNNYITRESGSTAYYCNDNSPHPNHQITIVGWDDNYSANNFKSTCRPQSNGAWLCKNSWGTDWGDSGYFWISYCDVSCLSFAGYSMQSTRNLCNNYTYNGALCFNYIDVGSTTIAGNVFKAKNYESLSAVSTMVLNPTSATVEISVYTDLPSDYTNPTQGTLALSWTTNIPSRTGLHTIDLPQEIDLTPGSIFSVVFTCHRESAEGYIIPAEGGETYTCRPGESFMYYEDDKRGYCSGWVDLYNESDKNNIYIQAITKCNEYTNCEHQFKTETTSATCIKEGIEKVFCHKCGLVTSEKALPLGDHSFGSWSDYVENDSGDKLVSTRTCSECGHTETQEKDAPDNNDNIIVNVVRAFVTIIDSIFNFIKSLF